MILYTKREEIQIDKFKDIYKDNPKDWDVEIDRLYIYKRLYKYILLQSLKLVYDFIIKQLQGIIEIEKGYNDWEIILENPQILVDSNKNIEPPPKVKSKKKSSIVSFLLIDYKVNNTKLTDVHNSLNKSLIDSDDVENFKLIFNNKIPNSKVKWLGSPSELYYFVYLLSLNKYIKRRSFWIVTPELFELVKSPDYDMTKLSSLKKPVKAAEIERAVNHLK